MERKPFRLTLLSADSDGMFLRRDERMDDRPRENRRVLRASLDLSRLDSQRTADFMRRHSEDLAAHEQSPSQRRNSTQWWSRNRPRFAVFTAFAVRRSTKQKDEQPVPLSPCSRSPSPLTSSPPTNLASSSSPIERVGFPDSPAPSTTPVVKKRTIVSVADPSNATSSTSSPVATKSLPGAISAKPSPVSPPPPSVQVATNQASVPTPVSPVRSPASPEHASSPVRAASPMTPSSSPPCAAATEMPQSPPQAEEEEVIRVANLFSQIPRPLPFPKLIFADSSSSDDDSVHSFTLPATSPATPPPPPSVAVIEQPPPPSSPPVAAVVAPDVTDSAVGWEPVSHMRVSRGSAPQMGPVQDYYDYQSDDASTVQLGTVENPAPITKHINVERVDSDLVTTAPMPVPAEILSILEPSKLARAASEDRTPLPMPIAPRQAYGRVDSAGMLPEAMDMHDFAPDRIEETDDDVSMLELESAAETSPSNETLHNVELNEIPDVIVTDIMSALPSLFDETAPELEARHTVLALACDRGVEHAGEEESEDDEQVEQDVVPPADKQNEEERTGEDIAHAVRQCEIEEEEDETILEVQVAVQSETVDSEDVANEKGEVEPVVSVAARGAAVVLETESDDEKEEEAIEHSIVPVEEETGVEALEDKVRRNVEEAVGINFQKKDDNPCSVVVENMYSPKEPASPLLSLSSETNNAAQHGGSSGGSSASTTITTTSSSSASTLLMPPTAEAVLPATNRSVASTAALDAMSQLSPDSEGSSDGISKRIRVIQNCITDLARLYKMLDNRQVRRAHISSDVHFHTSARDTPGWECCYLNAASLISNLLRDETNGQTLRRSGIFEAPAIDEIASRIETAWRDGYDDTGGARYGGTLTGRRAYIGVVEVAVLLVAAGIHARVRAFDASSPRGRRELFDWTFSYFDRSCASRRGGCTLHSDSARSVAPLILQWPGHSVLVVGAERLRRGDARLLVLDPVRPFADALTARGVRARVAATRWGENHPALSAHRFQLVFIDPHPAVQPLQRAPTVRDSANADADDNNNTLRMQRRGSLQPQAPPRRISRLSGKFTRRSTGAVPARTSMLRRFSWRRSSRKQDSRG